MNEINNILNTTVILWGERLKLSVLGLCYNLNYEIFILLKPLKQHENI